MTLQWLKDFVIPVATFVAGILGGLFFRHVQRPLTDYRTTLNEISHTVIRNILLMVTEYEQNPTNDEQKKIKEKLLALHETFKDLHARLLSSASTLPKLSIPLLRFLRLVRPQQATEEGAVTLIGISNQIVSPNKDLPHLSALITRLGAALDINVGSVTRSLGSSA